MTIISVTEHLDQEQHSGPPKSYTVDQLQKRLLCLEEIITDLLEKLNFAVVTRVTDSGFRMGVAKQSEIPQEMYDPSIH